MIVGWFIIAVISFICTLVGGVLLKKMVSNDDTKSICIFGTAIFLVISIGMFLCSTIFSFFLPIQAEAEYKEFEYTREIVEKAYAQGTELDNVAITNSIIEANKWLAKAKADKDIYGIFSNYFMLDLDSVEPITLQSTSSSQ